ncbi:MAG: pectate lyase family protein [Verrucomicrobiota bacterium]
MQRAITATVTLALTIGLFANLLHADIPAFPGAEGGGAAASGGRGGDVYHVTTLADNGEEGSLRYGIETADGPRTIVFDTGGTIQLESTLAIIASNLTIAGQTAPGGGITLAGYPVSIGRHKDGVENVIVRCLRFRCGDIHAIGNKKSGGNEDLKGSAADALNVLSSTNVILDHVSASWSMDEVLSVTHPGSANVTVQYSIISEPLNKSFHDKGAHGYGSISSTDDGVISIHHNLYAHARIRTPRVSTATDGIDGKANGAVIDVRNNLIHDFAYLATYTTGRDDNFYLNMVGNVYKSGRGRHIFTVSSDDGEPDTHVYFDDNRLDGKPTGRKNTRGKMTFVDKPHPVPSVTTHDSETVEEVVLAYAGAYPERRDAVDARIVEQARKGSGRVIDSQEQVGGFPELDAGAAPKDSDRDGMPDAYEEANGLDPTDPADRNDVHESGYTQLEVYLNSLVNGFPAEKMEANPE